MILVEMWEPIWMTMMMLIRIKRMMMVMIMTTKDDEYSDGLEKEKENSFPR